MTTDITGITTVFRVIKLIDSYKLVVNAGLKQGLCFGDKLVIYEHGEEVLDPFTGKNLGTLDIIKATVLVERCHTKMCICVNAETLSNPIGSPKPLPVDAEQISGPFLGVKIKVGDLVKREPNQQVIQDVCGLNHRFLFCGLSLSRLICLLH